MITFLYYTDKNNERHVGLPPVNPSWTHHQSANLDRNDYWTETYTPSEFKDGFVFKTIDEIPPGEKYVIYVDYYQGTTTNFQSDFTFVDWRHPRAVFPMPTRIWEDSANGLVHWVFEHSSEAYLFHDPIVVQNFDIFKAAFNVRDPKNITLISGIECNGKYGQVAKDECAQHGYNIITGYGFWGHRHRWLKDDLVGNNYVQTKIKNICNNRASKYKSVCYARIPRCNKMLAVAYIMHEGLDKESLFSLGVNNHGDMSPNYRYDNNERLTNKDILKLKDKDLLEVYKKIESSNELIFPHIREPNVKDLTGNLAQVISAEHGYESYFQLSNETMMADGKYPFLTEKSYKPFYMLQPFVMNGPRGCVQVLKERGFDVFEKYIDHSYDSILDNTKRWEKALTEFKRLHNLSHDQWNIMLREMLEGLLHNNHHVSRLPPRLVANELFPILIRFSY